MKNVTTTQRWMYMLAITLLLAILASTGMTNTTWVIGIVVAIPIAMSVLDLLRDVASAIKWCLGSTLGAMWSS